MIKLFLISLASGFGTGYSPIASGTVGSLLAALLYWFVLPRNSLILLAITVFVFIISIPICTYAEKVYGKKDDGRIVLDEVVGYFCSVVFLPFSWKIAVIAFILFRIMDVLKPFGIRKSQNLPGGWGIVVDDVLAGIATNLILQFSLFAFGLIL